MSGNAPHAEPAPAELQVETVARFLGGLWQINRRLKQLVAPVLADVPDLDLQRYLILRSIESGVVYPKDLSMLLQIIPTQLSRSLDQLVTQGLVERRHDAQDSRRTRLSLTPTGQTLSGNVSRAVMSAVTRRLQHASPERLDAVVAAIELLSSEGGLLDPAPLSSLTPPEHP